MYLHLQISMCKCLYANALDEYNFTQIPVALELQDKLVLLEAVRLLRQTLQH